MKTIRLLTIGNSFSQNALTYLDRLAAEAGQVTFDIGRASLGGCSLEKHWNLSKYTNRHPEYKPYCLDTDAQGTPRRVTLQEALAAKPWDYVTLQQVSRKSWLRASFEPYLSGLHALAQKLAPQAEFLLHQTWAYRTDSPFFPENGLSQSLMFERISACYRHYGAALGCRFLPSGAAVQRARETAGRTFVWPEPGYAYHRAVPPSLPEQAHSLAVGWHWNIANAPEGIPELRLDANHLNAAGCYLAGCVWYGCLGGGDPGRLTYVPEAFDGETASFLRSIARETVTAEWLTQTAPSKA